MSANESAEGAEGAGEVTDDGAADPIDNEDPVADGNDGDDPGDQAAVAGGNDAASVGSGHGELTTAEFLAMGNPEICLALARRELSPEHRADAGFLDPTTLRNEEIAAIWSTALISTYIRRMDVIRDATGFGPTTSNEPRVQYLLRNQLHRAWRIRAICAACDEYERRIANTRR